MTTPLDLDLSKIADTARIFRVLTAWLSRTDYEWRIVQPYSGRVLRLERSRDWKESRLFDAKTKDNIESKGHPGTYANERFVLSLWAESVANEAAAEIEKSADLTAQAQAWAELWGAIYGTDLAAFERQSDPAWKLPEEYAMPLEEWVAAGHVEPLLARFGASWKKDPVKVEPAPPPTPEEKHEKPQTVGRVIFRCGSCKKRWSVEYDRKVFEHQRTKHSRVPGFGERTYTVRDVQLSRKLADGKVVSWNHDLNQPCPKCGRVGFVNGGAVQGKYSDTPCGAKCLSATGFQCECRCGGQNHGKGLSL